MLALISPDAALLRDRASVERARRRPVRRRRACWPLADARRRPSRWPTRWRPSTSSWWATRPRRWPAACAAPAACSWAATPPPPSATTWRAPTTCCPPAAPRGSSRRCRRPPSGAGWRAYRCPTAPPRAWPRGRRARARGGLSRPRRVDGAAGVSRTRDISRTTGETDIRLAAGPRRRRRGRARDRRRLLRPHARRRGPPRRLDLDVQVDGRPGDRPAPHRRGHRPRASARRWTRRSATARASAATATRWCRWTRRAPARRSTCRAGPSPPSRPTCRRRAHRRLRRRPGRGVLPRGGQHGQADAAPAPGGGHQHPPHGRGAVQGVRPGAARGGGRSTRRERRAVDQGRSCDSRSSTTAWATCARSRRPRARGRRGRAHARPRRGARAPTASCCPAWARSRGRWRACARWASTSCCASGVEAGVPVIGHVPGHAAAVRVLHRARRRRRASGCSGVRCEALDAPRPEGPADRLEPGVAGAAQRARRRACPTRAPSTTCTRSPRGR